MVVMRSIDLIFDIIDCPDHPLLLENSLENVFDCSLRYRYVGGGWGKNLSILIQADE